MKFLTKILCVSMLALAAGEVASADVSCSWDSYSPQSTTIGASVYLNGWVRDYAHADGTLVANIYVDGNFAAQVGMTDYRPDIGGTYGWHCTIDTSGLSAGTHAIDVWMGNNTYGGWVDATSSYVQGSGTLTLSIPVYPAPTGSVSGSMTRITSSNGSYSFTATANVTSYSWWVFQGGSLVASNWIPNTSSLYWGYGSGVGDYHFYVVMSGPGGSANTNTITTTLQSPRPFLDFIQGVAPASFSVIQGSNLTGSGWALDYQNGAPIPVTLYVDGTARSGAISNGLSRPDVQIASVSDGWSPDNDVTASGYSITFNTSALSVGSHTMYLTATDSFVANHPDFTATFGSYSFTVTAAPDSTPPSVPGGLGYSAVTMNSFTLSWTASTDNVAVTGYEVFKDGVSYGTTASTSLSITGLSIHTAYSMTVKARDAAGNWSAASTALSVTTSNDPNADDDHDTLTNDQETLLGTNPNVAAIDGTGTINLKTNTPR